SDVRFRDPGLVRGLIVGGIREALAQAGVRAATTTASAMVAAFRPGGSAYGGRAFVRAEAADASSSYWSPDRSFQRPLGGFGEAAQAVFEAMPLASADARASIADASAEHTRHPLGAARAHIHENYIVAQTEDSL